MTRTLFSRVVFAVVIGIGAMACSADGSSSPVAPSRTMNNTSPSVERLELSIVPPSDQLTLIGGLSLEGYCRSLGYANTTLTKPQIGPNAAFNNWRCLDADGGLHPFSMERACQWQWGTNAIQAHPKDRDDAFTWVCYQPPRGRTGR